MRAGDADYDAARARYNARIDRRPEAIALCTSTEDVVAAVRMAGRNDRPVAIRSGGHCFEGFSTNDGGIVVDLSAMNRVTRLPGDRVRVQPGCRLASLYDALLPDGRVVPAGSCGGVGVAGLTLGGGYGFFSRAMGLTCDSLESLVLVDADGALRSTDDDPELLWACRGGGNGNFGVVVDMVFRTHPAPALVRRHRFRVRGLDAARANELLERWFALAAALPRTWFSAFVLNHRTLTVVVRGHDEGDEGSRRMIDVLGADADDATIPPPQPIAENLRGGYGLPGPVVFENASAGLYRGFETLRACALDVVGEVVATPGMIFQVNTLGGRIADPELARGSAYPHRDAGFLGELQTYWERPERERPLLEAFARVQRRLAEAGIRDHYVNYPDLGLADPLRSYYGLHLERLRAVKRRYDPTQRFRHPHALDV